MPHTPKHDFRFANHGSVTLLQPMTKEAEAWIEYNLPENATFFGQAVVIEPRYAGPILDAIKNDGMEVAA